MFCGDRGGLDMLDTRPRIPSFQLLSKVIELSKRQNDKAMKTSSQKTLLTLVAALALGGAAHAAVLVTYATLDGPSEAPPNASPGTGTATVTYDSVAHTLRVQTSFSGLLAGVTAAHIHAPTALPNTGTAGVATPVPTFPGFPSGVTSGSYDQTFDLTLASSWNPTFINNNGGTPAGAEAALAAALMSQRAYLNIHTTQFSGGEIRGFLAVPEPGTYALLAGLGLCAFAACRRFQRG